MCKLSFVILHYIAIDETKKAIASILERCDLTTSEYAIIVVDNASPNESGKIIENEYLEYKNIFVIVNHENKGFSAGLNEGFLFAKNKLECKYIVLMNNDTILLSNDFYNKIKFDYENYNFAVLGPRIYLNEDKNGTANPVNKEDYNSKRLQIKKWDCRILFFLNFIGLDLYYARMRRWLSNRIRIMLKKRKPGTEDLEYYSQLHEDVMLHGCFWIFSPLYVDKFDGLQEITFMYHEEVILYRQVRNSNMQMLYDPEIKIIHGEHVSTNSICSLPKSNRKIRYKRELKSLAELFRYLNSV